MEAAAMHGLVPADADLAPSPLSLNRKTLMMWIFIISDALLFGSFLAVAGYERFIHAAVWPDRWQIFDPAYLGAMTALLLSSSTLMATAVESMKNGKKGTFAVLYTATILCGLVFFLMQYHEYMHLIYDERVTLTSNPWNLPIFSSLFFLITGFHGFHVFTGVSILILVGILRTFGKASDDTVELMGLYWSFVDLVWVFIFTVVYLL